MSIAKKLKVSLGVTLFVALFVVACNSGKDSAIDSGRDSCETLSDLRSNYLCNYNTKGTAIFVESEDTTYVCKEKFFEKDTYDWIIEGEVIQLTYEYAWDKDSLGTCDSTTEAYNVVLVPENFLYRCESGQWRGIMGPVFKSYEAYIAEVPCNEQTKCRFYDEKIPFPEEEQLVCAKLKNEESWQLLQRKDVNYFDYDYCNSDYRRRSDSIIQVCNDKYDDFKKSVRPKGITYADYDEKTEVLTDARDGRTYKTAKVGKHIWMLEDLAYHDSNVLIDSNKNYKWTSAVDSLGLFTMDCVGCGSHEFLCENVARPYYPIQGICPGGWHLPTTENIQEDFAIMGIEGEVDAVDESNMLFSNKSYSNSVGSWSYSGFYCLASSAGTAVRISYAHRLRPWEGEKRWHVGLALYSYTGMFNEWLAGTSSISGDMCSVRCIKDELEENTPSLAMSSSSSEVSVKGTMTDERDGRTYKITTIGNQIWMAENLNFEMENSCCYNDIESYCSKYGRLYTWENAKKACLSGWHLPTKTEFETLISTIEGNQYTKGKGLKSTSGWNGGGNGLDSYSFTALPAGGKYDKDGSEFNDEGNNAYFWSSTDSGGMASFMVLSYDYDNVNINVYKTNDVFFSIRCIKD